MKNPINLDVKFTYIVGRNGSGKTTLIKKLIEEEYSKKYKIAYLDQYAIKSIDRILISVEELINSANYLINDDSFETRKNELIEYFNISKLLKNKTNELSGGEKQIILIILQLVKNADIYIFDEPFNNLDSTVIHNLTSYLQELAVSKNVIVISHHLDEIVKHSQIYEIIDHEIKS